MCIRDSLTVGECTGVTLEEAKKYASSNEKELNMAFQFEHVTLDADTNNKWGLKPLNLVKLKEVMTKWQVGLEEDVYKRQPLLLDLSLITLA